MPNRVWVACEGCILSLPLGPSLIPHGVCENVRMCAWVIFMGSIVVSVVRSTSRRWRDVANGSLTSDHDPTRTFSWLVALLRFSSCVSGW